MGTPVVGVTGSIGTGKSTFARMLTESEGQYVDADRLAKNLMKPGREAYERVIDEFGQEILNEDGYIDSDRLAERVFQDLDELEKLEGILHPLVVDAIAERVQDDEHSFYVVEAPLLYEAGVDTLCDWVVVVTASKDRVRERLKDRDIDPDEIERRRSRQLPQEEKVERADEVVDNNGTVEELRQKAQKIRQTIHDRFFEDGH